MKPFSDRPGDAAVLCCLGKVDPRRIKRMKQPVKKKERGFHIQSVKTEFVSE